MAVHDDQERKREEKKEKNKREKKKKEECVSHGLLLVTTFIDVDGIDVPFGAFYDFCGFLLYC